VLLVFSANRGLLARDKIITPLKDRIGAEIARSYPSTVAEHFETKAGSMDRPRFGYCVEVPDYLRELWKRLVPGPDDKRVDKRSGVQPAFADFRARKCCEQRRAAAQLSGPVRIDFQAASSRGQAEHRTYERSDCPLLGVAHNTFEHGNRQTLA